MCIQCTGFSYFVAFFECDMRELRVFVDDDVDVENMFRSNSHYTTFLFVHCPVCLLLFFFSPTIHIPFKCNVMDSIQVCLEQTRVYCNNNTELMRRRFYERISLNDGINSSSLVNENCFFVKYK